MKGCYNISTAMEKKKRAFAKFSKERNWFSCVQPEKWCLPVILAVLFIAACSGGGESPSSALSNDYTAFNHPEIVTINGYSGDAMEPFISHNGAYLFFNSAGGPTGKDLFYATFVNDTTFQYQGAISAVNSPTVDGAPSMDSTNKLYYVSRASYNPPTTNTTLFVGTWNGSTVSGSTSLGSLTIATPFIIYFDIEVSPDGHTLYLSKGDFRGGGSDPSAADIVIAVDSGNGYILDPNSGIIMANVNTDKLEYAPAISANGLELFFTRFNPSARDARIYRAVRSNVRSAFGMPQLVRAIEGFVEGPALSPDEKSLYYHQKNTNTGRFEIYRVTRP